MQLFSAGGSWQHVAVPLEGPRLRGGGWPYRTAVFSIALLNADSRAELDNFVLSGDGGANLLRNADFSRGLAHWFPVAKDYYIPWHIDNVYLEVLIERGIVGAATFALLLASALTALLSPRVRELPIAPFLVASLVGALLVGMVSSLLDVPRVAFLLFFLACLSIQLAAAHRSPE